MTRSVLARSGCPLASLISLGVLWSCGGATPSAPALTPGPAPAPDPALVEPAAPPPDPAQLARAAYANPGGMWLPAQMTLPQHVDNFQKLGVAIDPKVLADPLATPLAAVVFLGGCTASFVSPQGLLVTNHHCVQGALQLNSTPKENLVESGFLARTLAEEKSAGPAQRVMVAQAFRDVTSELRAGLEAIADPLLRKEEAERRQKRLQSACEQGRPGLRCEVRHFFRGAMYLLIEYLELRDVRLVYAPKRSIGNYGGEIDNWAWPRHTGDFSFYRAYVGKDGKPADYSPDNVPFAPAHHLTVSSAGVKASDVVMVAGYPGATNRIATASEVHHDVEWRIPYLIGLLEQRYAIAEAHLADGGQTAIKAGVAKQGIQNGLERWQGVHAGMTQRDLLPRKDALDAQVKAWAAAPGREAYAAALARLEQVLAEERRSARLDFDRGQAVSSGSLLGAALTAVRLQHERRKPDAERKPGFQERDMPRIIAGQKQVTRQYDRVLDRAVLKLVLTRALQLPAQDRGWLATLLGAKKGQKLDEAAIEKTLNTWYETTRLEDEAARISLVTETTAKALATTKDPFVAAAVRIWPVIKDQETRADRRTGELLLLTNVYATAMREAQRGFLAPDANGTLRVSYGTVKSFKPGSSAPADAPFTTADQLLGKDQGKEPFDAPAAVLQAVKVGAFGPYANEQGKLPINFLTDLDTTGGNSGSPILDHRGHLVGLHFDRPLAAVASDMLFDHSVSRTITVDARYMLWMMDAIDGADHLLTEMGLVPAIP